MKKLIIPLMLAVLLSAFMIPRVVFADGQGQITNTHQASMTIPMHIRLLPGQETPPVTESNASGLIDVGLIDNGNALEFRLTVCNIANVTMAHIHVGAFGKPGPVILFLYHMHAPLFSSVHGCDLLSSGTLHPSDLISSPVNGIDNWTDFVNALLSGNTYANVHTSAHPAGEIRGQLVPHHTSPDFSLRTTIRGIGLPQGSSDNSNEVNVTSINGFSGNVTLSAVVSPVVPNGPTISFYVPIVTVPSGGSATTIIWIWTMSSTPLGNYTVTITGQSGSLSRTTSFFVIVSASYQPPDFSLTANPTTVTATLTRTVQFVNSSLTLISLNGFSGTISLSFRSDPGPAVLVDPSSIVLTSGGTANATLAIEPFNAGTYTVTVTGSCPGCSDHSVTVTFNIQPLV